MFLDLISLVWVHLQEIEFDSGFALVLGNGKELCEVVMSNVGSQRIPVLIQHPLTTIKQNDTIFRT